MPPGKTEHSLSLAGVSLQRRYVLYFVHQDFTALGLKQNVLFIRISINCFNVSVRKLRYGISS